MADAVPSSRGSASLASAFRLPFEGARLLARERRLWPLALAPVLLSLAAFASALAGVVAFSGDLYGLATSWMPALEAARWWAWLWIGPAKLLFWGIGAALFLVLAAAAIVLAYLVASLLASPFHDALARRVEQLVTGGVEDATDAGAVGLLREGLRAVAEEARRLLFFLALIGPLVLIGLFVPGAQIVTGPAITVVTIFFLPLDYASYTLDRRHVAFPEKRRWASGNLSGMAGFGLAAFLLCAVPGVNFVAMPALVVGGTLLVLRHPPRRATRSPGADAGTPTLP